MSRAAALLLVLAVPGCVHAPGERLAGQTLPPGHWGGQQVTLDIAPDGRGTITLSCAQAEFAGPVKLDVGGHFLTQGTFTRGTGVATIEPPPSVPANISGRMDGDSVLWLDVATHAGYPVRSARLQRGAAGELLRCL